MSLTFAEARATVLRETRRRVTATELIPALDAPGRIIAESIASDRDYPPFPRSARDGFAVRAADLPGELDVIGEVRAGAMFDASVGVGQAVEIMTGAPLPAGADAVVMVEHTTREGNRVKIARTHESGDNFSPRGIEAKQGAIVLEPGRRLGFADIALLAMVGRDRVLVYRKPRVAIIPTGDEIVDVKDTPQPFQIRNSNAWSMAAQVARAGGDPVILPIARDHYEDTYAKIDAGLKHDMVLLSGGVSAGKYDIVERVLADFGATFYFDRVKIQPGQPLVFGEAQEVPFFGLPGNPASTMVTFEVFARAALELISGAAQPMLPFVLAPLSRDFRQKTGLTRFLPARLAADGSSVEPEPWEGSGDIAALARANAFLVTDPERECWAEGDLIQVLLK